MAERYASLVSQCPTYPEVPELFDSFGDRDYRYHIERGNAELIPRPISISLHVPEDPGNNEHYTEQLLREIELVAPLVDRDRDVVRVRWTGTPGRLGAQLSARVLDSIARHFHVTAGAEVSCRVTFGLVPHSWESLRATLHSACDAHPDSIDLVDGALLRTSGTPVQALDAAVRLSMLERAASLLADLGYAHACKDRFVLGDSGDAPCDADQVGLGTGSISCTGGGVCHNFADVREWQSALDRQRLPVARGRSLTRLEHRRAELLRAFLCGAGIDVTTTKQTLCDDDSCLEKLRHLENCGLVSVDAGRVCASSRGRYLWRILAQCFDPDSNHSAHAEGGAPDVEGRQRGIRT